MFCFKEGGDHQLDVTSGIEIIAAASPSEKTELVAGKGVGRISGRGLCAPIGHAAISQSARKQIMEAIIEGLVCTGLKGVMQGRARRAKGRRGCSENT